MTMYLVLSALTSSPISLVAATKASAFSFRVCIPPPSILTSSALPKQMCAQFNAVARRFGTCFRLLGIRVTVQSLTLSEVWAESLFATNRVLSLTKPLLGISQRPGAPPPMWGLNLDTMRQSRPASVSPEVIINLYVIQT